MALTKCEECEKEISDKAITCPHCGISIKKYYESVYPDILFHFTTKDGLLSILENNFNLSYAREKIQGITTIRELGVPMVSFCDLKLSELKLHMSKYGYYGIGLTKEWANRMGLNPVMYLSRYCEFADNFNNALYRVYPMLSSLKKNNSIEKISQKELQILDAYRYMKNYEGELIRDGKIIEKNFRFADEREWRYVPSLNDQGIQDPFVAKSNIDTKAKKDAYNNKIKGVRLTFKPDDIKYLIVKNESEIIEIINHIDSVKLMNNSPDDLKRLSSRILTAEQIKNDI
jgi:hypothetical protein